MLPVNPGGHAAYQDHVLNNLRKYYPDFSSLPKSSLDTLERFFALNIDNVDVIMKNRYSVFGPMPRLPSCMLRSYLLSFEFDIHSVTNWAAALKTNPLYAIASGFDFGDTPGVGTFYDFFDRLWLSEDDNFSPNLRKPKPKKPKKPKKKAKKGEKAESIEKESVEELLKRLSIEPISTDQPYSLLVDIYKDQFLNASIEKGLVNPASLSLAGDGMPVYTSARERKERVCNCLDNGDRKCSCERIYSQPDCDIGWDSSRGCFFHGYNLYNIVDSGSANDLPIFPLFHPGSRHDSIAFVNSFFTMKAFFPELKIDKFLLDSAHDAMPIYEFFFREKITPFIDLNERGAKIVYKDDFTVSDDGIPYCSAGLRMNKDGSDKDNYRLKFRCPLFSRKYGCKCETPCSDAKYGRTVHLHTSDNPRIFNIPSRDSEEWKDTYKGRTSAERCNKRQIKDFSLESGNHRSSKLWYCRLFGILMLQHLNAWPLSVNTLL